MYTLVRVHLLSLYYYLFIYLFIYLYISLVETMTVKIMVFCLRGPIIVIKVCNSQLIVMAPIQMCLTRFPIGTTSFQVIMLLLAA